MSQRKRGHGHLEGAFVSLSLNYSSDGACVGYLVGPFFFLTTNEAVAARIHDNKSMYIQRAREGVNINISYTTIRID